jgi:hypothetical protein
LDAVVAGIGQGKPYFRQWLAHKLASTRQTLPKAEDQELAQWLGVTVEVLQEAQKLRQGTRSFGGFSKFDGVQTMTWRCILPCPVEWAFEELAKARDLPTGTLLRSVIHWVLTQYELPTTSNYQGGGGWTLFGTTYRLARKAAESGKAKSRCDTSAFVTRGAQEALNTRACLRSTVATALVRGGLIDLLEGRIQTIEIISNAAYMFDRAADYYPKWREHEVSADQDSDEAK